MSWRDELLPGSFRGVPFHVDRHGLGTGRRVARHEFPGQDRPYPEDLGRKTRVHRLELFVLGPAYMADRDRLLDALEQAGPGELVHPYLGRRTVQVEDVDLSESTAEGGRATFSVVFVETEARPRLRPTVEVSTARAVEAAADQAETRAADGFSRSFAVGQRPAFVAEAGAALVGRLTAELEDLQRRFPRVPEAVAAGVASLAALSNAASSLVRTPFNLAAQVVGLVGDVADWVQQPFDALRLYQDLSRFGEGLGTVLGSTTGRALQRGNQAAFVRLVREAAVAAGARLTASLAYTSSTEALAVRETWAGLLDERMAEAGDDGYLVLQGLRAAVVRDLTARGAQLPRVVRVELQATRPSLEIAYALYGLSSEADLEARAADLVARNGVRHPGFVPGGQALEVLQGEVLGA